MLGSQLQLPIASVPFATSPWNLTCTFTFTSSIHGFFEAEHNHRTPRPLLESQDAATHPRTMSLYTALARVELEYLSDMDRCNALVVRDVSYISTLQEDGIGGAFEKSLRVKGMIDELEALAEEVPAPEMNGATTTPRRLWKLKRTGLPGCTGIAARRAKTPRISRSTSSAT